MGWSSANSIFDPVAEALINAEVDGPTKRKVLADLIKGLQDGDWDTCDESLERFMHDPAIVLAFADNGVVLTTVSVDVAPQDADAVREFAEHRAERRIAKARGTDLCNQAPLDYQLAWLTCTHDVSHDGECSWYRDPA
ncbi:hypothetical protein OG216_09830 [Streptomycetaceae bacterium NBC_01309]